MDKPKVPNEVTVSGTAQPSNRRIQTRPLMIIVSVILIAVVATAVIMAFVTDNKTTNTSSKTPAIVTNGPTYHYKDLVASVLNGPKSSIEFNRPKELGLNTNTVSSADYVHTGTDNRAQLSNIAAMLAQTAHPIIAEDHTDLTKLADAFNASSGNDYQTYLSKAGITNIVNTELSKRYFDNKPASQFKTTFERPAKLTNATITKDGWLIDFSSQYNDEKVKGQVAFVLGPSTDTLNSYYYLMASTVDYNWDANAQIWHQVFDSMKVAEKPKS